MDCKIENEKTQGCDKISRAYCDNYNALRPLYMAEGKVAVLGNIQIDMKNMDVFDRSALGLYIGKFVEQEINSSVVQLMRYAVGIDMPSFYCKRNPAFWDDEVQTQGKRIRLNQQEAGQDYAALKTIPLGDAYYALESLKRECSVFDKYDWLYDRAFLDAWRKLFGFRNKVAHIGHLITQKELDEAFGWFETFLCYMPKIKELKIELAPDGMFDEEEIPVAQPNASVEKPIKDKKPQGTPEHYAVMRDLLSMADKLSSEQLQLLSDCREKYSWFTTVFDGPDGKKGMRHADGSVLVPAIYDDFGYTYDCLELRLPVLPAMKNGKYGLVKCDGTGAAITDFCYDRIGLVPYNSQVFCYWKGGSLAFGLLLATGKELCPCIIDECYEPMQTCMIFRCGDYYGLYDLGERVVMPMYDNIEWVDTYEPLVFTLNGILGYLDADLKFVPQSEVDAIEDEDERHDRMLDFLTGEVD